MIRREIMQRSLRRRPVLEQLEQRCLLAIDTLWVGGASGDFNDAGEWSDGAPNANMNAVVHGIANTTIYLDTSFPNPQPSAADSMRVTNGSHVVLEAAATPLAIGDMLLIGSAGDLQMSSLEIRYPNVTFTGTDPIGIFVANGTLSLSAPQAANDLSTVKSKFLDVGGKVGHVSIADRVTVELDSAEIGTEKTGSLYVGSGGTLKGQIKLAIGGKLGEADQPNADGTVTVSGEGALIEGFEVTLGVTPESKGNLNVIDNGELTNASAIFVGDEERSRGTLTVATDGQLTAIGSITVAVSSLKRNSAVKCSR